MIREIIDILSKKYPNNTINIWSKADKGKLFCDEAVVAKFDPNLLFLKTTMMEEEDNERFINNVALILSEYIDKFFAKKAKTSKRDHIKTITPGAIKGAIAATISANACAKYLNINIRTLKRLTDAYGIELKLNKAGFGTKKGCTHKGYNIPLDEILNNQHPRYRLKTLKTRLIQEGLLEEKCYRCGFEERRDYDMISPLVVDFIDGDNLNFNIKNIRLICFNCLFILSPPVGGNASVKIREFIEKNKYREEILKH